MEKNELVTIKGTREKRSNDPREGESEGPVGATKAFVRMCVYGCECVCVCVAKQNIQTIKHTKIGCNDKTILS